MTFLGWICLVWVTLALEVYWFFFCVGARNEGRGSGVAAAAENLRMYNPFSWPGCVTARINNLRGFICEHGRKHDTLGLITRADLDDPAKRDLIAREAFISRTQFWATGAFNYCKMLMLTGILGLLLAGVLLKFFR